MINKQFRELVFYSIGCNLKAEMNRYALSYFWWIMEPALHLIILYVVFGVFFGQSADPLFIPFLFCGLVPWIWFNKSISNGLDSIVNGRGIIRDKHIPKYFFPTVSIIQDTIKELFVFIILMVILLLSNLYPNENWLFLPLVILLEFLFIASLAYLFSIIVPYFLDLKYIISTILQMAMFGAGTFYDFRTMPEEFHPYFLLNPIVLLINMYRDVLMYNKPINSSDFLYILAFVGVFGGISIILHKLLDKEVPKVLFR